MICMSSFLWFIYTFKIKTEILLALLIEILSVVIVISIIKKTKY